MRKEKAIFIFTVIVVLLFSGCSKKENNKQVRIAYFPNITHAQALVMKGQGSLELELGDEYQVEWLSFNAGPAEVEAIFAGEVDIGYIGPVPAINAYIKSGGDIRIIASASKAGAVLVTRPEVNINSIKDLAEKNVSVPQLGNTQHISLINILTENGLAAKSNGGDVNVLPTANADVKTLMETGQIDAALLPEPWGSILEEEIGAKILLDFDEVWLNGNYDVAVVIVNKDFLDEHSDIVEKFLKVHQASTLYINENIEDAKRIINQEIKTATSKAIDEKILDAAFQKLIISDKLSKESIDAFADINYKEGFIHEIPDSQQMIDESMLK